MYITRLVVSVLAICVSSVAFSSTENSELEAAKEQVNEYRALRRACSITQGEQRKVCFSQLNAATEDYKQAKKLLAMHEPSSQQPLLGQAQ